MQASGEHRNPLKQEESTMLELLTRILYEFTCHVYGNIKMIASHMLWEGFCQ